MKTIMKAIRQLLFNVDRIEVIDEQGRAYTKYGVTDVQFSVQDNGRTLKIFVKHQ